MGKKRVWTVVLLLCLILELLAGAFSGSRNMVYAKSTEKSIDEEFYKDYERAFWKGYVPSTYKKLEKSKQMTFEDYRSLLRAVLKEQGGNIKQFDKNVKKSKRKLTRGEAIIMSYYAKNALSASFADYDSNEVYLKDSFWDSESETVLKKEFPSLYKQKKVIDANGNEWDCDFTAAYLWNAMFCSAYSGIPVVEFDNKKDMQTLKAFTVEDAICAVCRICDGIHAKDTNYVALTSKKAITPSLSLKAKSKVKSIDKLPRLTGFVLNAFKGEDKIYQTPEDIANVANWGFSSARVMLNYHMLFNEAANKVDLNQLEKLDELIATAEHYKIHLNLLMYQLPGRESWADMDYQSGGDFDLFLNESKQKKVQEIWKLIATRYKDVPGEYLSYTPFWEALNKNLSTGAEYTDYTPKDVVNTLDGIIQAMRKADKDCYIFYELTAINPYDETIEQSEDGYKKISKKYKNTMISYNYCDCAYVYYNMTATQGENIDNNNHSMFMQDYPNIIYCARSHVFEENPITMDGCLPEGTKLTLYIKRADGALRIMADDSLLFERQYDNAWFETSYLLSSYYPYATSTEKIEVTLNKTAKKILISCENGDVEWSGMDVTLPKSYAKKKWYAVSTYDQYLQGIKDAYLTKYEKRSTSNVMICPNDYYLGNKLTIHKNLTYTSESIYAQATKEEATKWGEAIHGLSPKCIIRFEMATFSNGCTRKSILDYYDTILEMYDEYNYNWYSNDYELILEDSSWKMPDAKLVKNGKYKHFNKELLELLQKYR